MTISALSASEIAAFNLDQPLIAGQSVVMEAAENESGFTAKWIAASGGSTDDSAVGFPATNAADGFHHRITKPNAAQNTWRLEFVLGASKEYDVFVIGIDGVGSLIDSIELRESDTSMAAAEASAAIASFSPLDNKRQVDLSLDGGLNKAVSQFIQLRFIDAGDARTPGVTEVYLGKRRQMLMFPDRPFDERPFSSGVELVESGGGVIAPYTRHKGRLQAAVQFTGANGTQRGLIQSWWDDSIFGTKPSCWVPEPSSNPSKAYFVYNQGGLMTMPIVGPGPFKSQVRLSLLEAAPFVKTET